MSFRGGKREGAGRKPMGETKQIKLTLRSEDWEWIEECVQYGHAASRSELIRNIIQEAKGGVSGGRCN